MKSTRIASAKAPPASTVVTQSMSEMVSAGSVPTTTPVVIGLELAFFVVVLFGKRVIAQLVRLKIGDTGLTDADADRYVREMRVLGLRLGADDLPVSAPGLREWIASHREVRASAAAHDAVRFLMLPPLPVAILPTYGVIAAGAVELLSLRQRMLLRLPSVPGVETLAVRPATGALLALVGWALGPPPPVAAWRADAGG